MLNFFHKKIIKVFQSEINDKPEADLMNSIVSAKGK